MADNVQNSDAVEPDDELQQSSDSHTERTVEGNPPRRKSNVRAPDVEKHGRPEISVNGNIHGDGDVPDHHDRYQQLSDCDTESIVESNPPEPEPEPHDALMVARLTLTANQ